VDIAVAPGVVGIRGSERMRETDPRIARRAGIDVVVALDGGVVPAVAEAGQACKWLAGAQSRNWLDSSKESRCKGGSANTETPV